MRTPTYPPTTPAQAQNQQRVRPSQATADELGRQGLTVDPYSIPSFDTEDKESSEEPEDERAALTSEPENLAPNFCREHPPRQMQRHCRSCCLKHFWWTAVMTNSNVTTKRILPTKS